MKYLYNKIIFEEIPDEISLGISISGCQIRCRGCHSQELWNSVGKDLTTNAIDCLVEKNQGISCILFFGGEHDIKTLISLFKYIKKQYPIIKVAWYCGLDRIPKDIYNEMSLLDYIKIGSWKMDRGPLNMKTTNQRLYKIKNDEFGNIILEDITYRFWKEKV